MVRRLLPLPFLALALAGCGSDEDPGAYKGAYQVEKIGHGFSVVRLPYQHHWVRCVQKNSGTSDQHHVRSISCDFVAFHHYFGYGKR